MKSGEEALSRYRFEAFAMLRDDLDGDANRERLGERLIVRGGAGDCAEKLRQLGHAEDGMAIHVDRWWSTDRRGACEGLNAPDDAVERVVAKRERGLKGACSATIRFPG